jgi:6-phosphogluconolactonase
MRQVEILDDPEALARRAVSHILQAAAESMRERGRFIVALSGGSTPEKTNELLALPENAARVDWENTFLFFGDERDVPPDDPRSNYAMVHRSLLTRVSVPAGNIYPMVRVPRAAGDAAATARNYAGVLRGFFGQIDLPRFDLIVLGMGDDGHCASLFPGYPSLDVVDEWVVASPPGVLPPPVDRMTITLPVINAARRVLFLVAGDHKSEAVRDILDMAAPPVRRPAAGVNPSRGSVTWLLDRPAAALLVAR